MLLTEDYMIKDRGSGKMLYTVQVILADLIGMTAVGVQAVAFFLFVMQYMLLKILHWIQLQLPIGHTALVHTTDMVLME